VLRHHFTLVWTTKNSTLSAIIFSGQTFKKLDVLKFCSYELSPIEVSVPYAFFGITKKIRVTFHAKIDASAL